LGTGIRGASVNGRAVGPQLSPNPWDQAVQPVVTAALTGKDVFSIDFIPVFEILPPENPTRTGDTNRGLRIIRSAWADGTLRLSVEGLAGTTYRLGLTRPDLVEKATGAVFENDKLIVRIPDGPVGQYLRHEVVLKRR
jgi:hypothetical protein